MDEGEEELEYAHDISQMHFRKQAQMQGNVDPAYMDRQAEINHKMRAILIDWLVEVQERYKLRYLTLHLTVGIIDRYLSLRDVKRRQLQLLGVTAMFIAAKYEEIDPPKADEFAHVTDSTYRKDEILNMEIAVLTALDCKVSKVTPGHFLEDFQRLYGCDAVGVCLAQYTLDLALLDSRCLGVAPSLLVSSALYVSSKIRGRADPWPAAMAILSTHAEAELQPCVELLESLLATASSANLQGVRRKYLGADCHRVASLVP